MRRRFEKRLACHRLQQSHFCSRRDNSKPCSPAQSYDFFWVCVLPNEENYANSSKHTILHIDSGKEHLTNHWHGNLGTFKFQMCITHAHVQFRVARSGGASWLHVRYIFQNREWKFKLFGQRNLHAVGSKPTNINCAQPAASVSHTPQREIPSKFLPHKSSQNKRIFMFFQYYLHPESASGPPRGRYP